MADNSTTAQYKKVDQLINAGRLNQAMEEISGAMPPRPDQRLLSLLSKQRETYRFLLHYLAEGYSDSSRGAMLAEIKSNLRYINDAVLRESVLNDSPDLYSSTVRLDRVRNKELGILIEDFFSAYTVGILAEGSSGSAEAAKEADLKLVDIFNHVMAMFGASAQEYATLADAVKSDKYPYSLKSQLVSALMLGNLMYFDRNAFLTLIDLFETSSDPRLSARILVSLVLISAAHPKRIGEDKAMSDRTSLWNDSPVMYRQSREVVLSLIRCRDTQRISSKMQDEIMPRLMKLRPDMLGKLRDVSESSEFDMLDMNPDWEDFFEKSGLGEKLRELTDIQMEGGDVMMMAFSNLKSFPFFKEAANWFLPFSAKHHDVELDNGTSGSLFSQLLDVDGVMCDSDKYSFVFSLSRMPSSQRDLMASRLNGQMEQLKEAMAERKLSSSGPVFDSEVTRFARDIYRFFKLFRKKEDFPDPFANPIDFMSLPVFGPILSDYEMLNLVGEFYFKHKYFSEALPILEKTDASTGGEPLLWEKIAYCHNLLGNIDEALKWYRKAELLNPDSLWLMKRMALCFHMLGNYRDSMEYYQKALDVSPDDFKLIMESGSTALDAGKYPEALKHYYHADYLKPESMRVKRALAWTELMNGNTARSIEIYTSILDNPDCKPADEMNAGHASAVSGDLKSAFSLYRKAAADTSFGLKGLEKGMEEDIPELHRLGADVSDLRLILEKLRTEL